MIMTKPNRNLPSNVYQCRNRYWVAQQVNGENKVYGWYDTREEAIQHRNQLVQKGVITNRVGKHRIKNYENRYIQKTHSNKYRIQKKIDGVIQHFGVFSTISEAREERDYLESIGWDYSEME